MFEVILPYDWEYLRGILVPGKEQFELETIFADCVQTWATDMLRGSAKIALINKRSKRAVFKVVFEFEQDAVMFVMRWL